MNAEIEDIGMSCARHARVGRKRLPVGVLVMAAAALIVGGCDSTGSGSTAEQAKAAAKTVASQAQVAATTTSSTEPAGSTTTSTSTSPGSTTGGASSTVGQETVTSPPQTTTVTQPAEPSTVTAVVTPATTTAVESSDDGESPWWVWLLVALVAAGAGALIYSLIHRRRARRPPAGSPPGEPSSRTPADLARDPRGDRPTDPYGPSDR